MTAWGSSDLTAMYGRRFSANDRRSMQAVWRVLNAYFFQRWIQPDDAVLDVGAGLCNFINTVKAGRKVAVDADPSTAARCAPDVSFVEAGSIAGIRLGGPFDVAFMSNFLEHLENGGHVIDYLKAVRSHLKPNGRLLILQPNFALVGPAYFDFIDHKTILTDKSLVEALELSGYDVVYLKRRFLPYTSKSSMPRAPWLVRLYLAFPPAHWFLGKQSFIVASPSSRS